MVDNDSPPTMVTYAYDKNNLICLSFLFYVLVPNCDHVLFIGVNEENDCLD